MALDFNSNVSVAPAADPKPVEGSSSDNALVKRGQEALKTEALDASMLGSKSNTLIYVKTLGDPTVPDKCRVGTVKENGQTVMITDANGKKKPKGIDEDCSGVCGYKFKTTEPITIKRISSDKTHATGFTNADFQEKSYPAGATLNLTILETMILLSKPEFSFRTAAMGKDASGADVVIQNGFKLAFKPESNSSKTSINAKFPTPYASLSREVGVAIKRNMVDIISEAGKTAVKSGSLPAADAWMGEDYAEIFTAMYTAKVNRKHTRAAANPDNKKNNDISSKNALAALCRSIEKKMLNG